MKAILTGLLTEVIAEARKQGKLKQGKSVQIILEVPKREGQGDFATTLALSLSKEEGRPPREIASDLVALLQGRSPLIEKIEIAGPGYINFFLSKNHWYQSLLDIREKKGRYGQTSIGGGKKVQIEFVSANPTGPLHVAHGRAAALGDALALLLQAVGYQVDREYYINDVGNQMTLLGRSTYLRYRELFGEKVTLPDESYRGSYVIEIAEEIKKSAGDRYLTGSEEEHLPFFVRTSYQTILGWIRRDLDQFGVRFDRWFPEEDLYRNKEVDASLEFLKSAGVLYEQDGALWVATTRFGDDKDRVVMRSNRQMTYFASDIAYHRNKFERGYDRLIDIWGADHHGYIARVKAVAAAMGYSPDRLDILIHQLVNLLREGKPVAMSKRSGEFVTLREVMDEVGVDATRFFFLMRRSDTSLDFDLDLAKKASTENPVYYVQYAHARVCSILRVATERGLNVETEIQNVKLADLTVLDLPEEQALIKQLSNYPDLLQSAAEVLEPHRLTFYLQELAGMLHRYYFDHRVVTEDLPRTRARLVLMAAVQIVLRNALAILGVRAPERM
ncbi:arginine--tRNA ligase [Candidatus Manganitrophus noduliformans]|uniref:Arginine--tRNA ligase n=1 Tax=Candidatus Manganitrophus noduliformans TaxID=2606439 RepID=A0A7X6IB64_9BACT|nr:arginine--tRNA ligase [Candidatus Manganitrophus noduliformans]NKE71471.1 arginine--tRNA ligase [Candidatus Manganitrophus noduliformans]